MQIIISLIAQIIIMRATRDFYPLNIYTLLFGDENLTAEENTIIFTAVHTFIKDTRRFTN